MMDIAINFEDTYEPIDIKSDFFEMTFNSPQKDGSTELIIVQVEPLNNPDLPNVYNIGFGPPDGKGRFRDDVRLKHADVPKVFSTVLFHSLSFLNENPKLIMGIDGSDDLRATLYQMMFKTNKNYLDEYFIPLGVDYYVRIFRDGSYEQDDAGNYIAKPRAEQFDYNRSRHDLYRYFLFRLK
jgi:hypothetical protein